MSLIGFLLFVAVIGLPIAWLVSEFLGGRVPRITLGIVAIVVVTASVSCLYGVLTRFNFNAWYGAASKDLVESTITQIEEGDVDRVMKVLRRLNLDYKPTYENRAHYDELVNDAVAEMNSESDLTGTNWDVGPFSRETWAGHWEDDSGFWLVIESYLKDLDITRSGDEMPKITDVRLSKDSVSLSFDEGDRWHHKLTLLNKYEAKHVWCELPTGNVWRTDTLHKLIRATPKQSLFTQQPLSEQE